MYMQGPKVRGHVTCIHTMASLNHLTNTSVENSAIEIPTRNLVMNDAGRLSKDLKRCFSSKITCCKSIVDLDIIAR